MINAIDISRKYFGNTGKNFTACKSKKSKISGKVAAKSDKIPWINSKNNIGDVQITSVNIYSEKEVLSINVENPKTNYVTETTNIIQFLNEVSCNVKFQFKTNLL